MKKIIVTSGAKCFTAKNSFQARGIANTGSTPMSSLDGQVIIVTGGASGIGLATTKRLISLGAITVVGDLPKTAPQSLSEDPGKAKPFYYHLDVSSRAACHTLVEDVVKKFGRLDALVNNAGICPAEGEIAPDSLFHKIMAVNLTGVWHMGTEAIMQMTRQGGTGAVVNTASNAALKGFSGLAAYSASKHGVLGLTRSWSKEFSGRGIRVNAVAPGKLFYF